MKRLLLAIPIVAVLLVGAWLARAAMAPRPTAATTQRIELPAGAGMRFLPVDILLDTGTHPLGAYQVEITAKNAAIVGLEGGDPAPFHNAPYYDPAALQPGPAGSAGRIIVAAFSTDANLPAGTSRVARLHLALSGLPGVNVAPDLVAKLVVATDGAGQTVDTRLHLRVVTPP
jgi:hypothetical protein